MRSCRLVTYMVFDLHQLLVREVQLQPVQDAGRGVADEGPGSGTLLLHQETRVFQHEARCRQPNHLQVHHVKLQANTQHYHQH